MDNGSVRCYPKRKLGEKYIGTLNWHLNKSCNSKGTSCLWVQPQKLVLQWIKITPSTGFSGFKILESTYRQLWEPELSLSPMTHVSAIERQKAGDLEERWPYYFPHLMEWQGSRCAELPQAQRYWVNQPRTETTKTMSQNKLHLVTSWFISGIYYSSD